MSRPDFPFIAYLWRSPWTSWVGLRYLRSKKNSRFLSFITLLSICGVALGVTSMIVVLSVMDGFEAELKKRLMASDVHVLIEPTPETHGFEMGFAPKEALPVDELRDTVGARHPSMEIFPVVSTEVILKLGRKVTGVVLKGAGPVRLGRLDSQIVERVDPQRLVRKEVGQPPVRLPGIFVGQELAYEMNLMPGDQVTLISPTETEGPLSKVPRLKRYAIEGIYRSGLPEQELKTVFAADSAVYSFLRRANIASQWEVTLRNFDDAPDVAQAIRAAAPGFRVRDWIELNSHLFASLRLERLSMSVILAFIVIVASFNIVTTLTLMVLEKKKEISIMKAMGARDGQVAAVFLAEGLLIGGIGTVSGIVLAFVICSLLRKYEFITLPDVFYDRTLPVTFDPLYYGGVALCAFLIVLGACLYPSRRAARINPLDGIRFG